MICFTSLQYANVKELVKAVGHRNVAFAGWDARMRPTFEVTDANGVQFIALEPDNGGDRPVPPVRDLTDDELNDLSEETAEVIYAGMRYAVHTTNPITQPRRTK